ncbi:hypothetical protein E2562_036047 [Oryza meyeriana var. granulata]|uniref:Uncharacterized protein n=1 Tax=Oryza meyeriana var. granulata TaxID=110450 RepID=A0A6G1CUZ3_9ORYZ|nr:hypothetical protein E2562_030055 [Oryza meyeriana var. granulata]KAF0909402.1 hypothetical protein E2562_036047 [Oryza meyeriana var. granulata]
MRSPRRRNTGLIRHYGGRRHSEGANEGSAATPAPPAPPSDVDQQFREITKLKLPLHLKPAALQRVKADLPKEDMGLRRATALLDKLGPVNEAWSVPSHRVFTRIKDCLAPQAGPPCDLAALLYRLELIGSETAKIGPEAAPSPPIPATPDTNPLVMEPSDAPSTQAIHPSTPASQQAPASPETEAVAAPPRTPPTMAAPAMLATPQTEATRLIGEGSPEGTENMMPLDAVEETGAAVAIAVGRPDADAADAEDDDQGLPLQILFKQAEPALLQAPPRQAA